MRTDAGEAEEEDGDDAAGKHRITLRLPTSIQGEETQPAWHALGEGRDSEGELGGSPAANEVEAAGAMDGTNAPAEQSQPIKLVLKL